MLVHLDCSIGYYVMEIIFCYFSESDVYFISFEYFRIRSVFGYRVSNHLSHIIAFHVLRVSKGGRFIGNYRENVKHIKGLLEEVTTRLSLGNVHVPNCFSKRRLLVVYSKRATLKKFPLHENVHTS